MKKRRELKKLGIQGKVIPMSDFAELSLDDFAKRLTEYGVSLGTDKVQELYNELRSAFISDSNQDVQQTKTDE